MLNAFQRVCACMLGLPLDTATDEDVESRMRVEVTRYHMDAGIFRGNQALLSAYNAAAVTQNAEALALAAGITIPPEEPAAASMQTLATKLNQVLGKLDQILAKL